jgi:serine/threonine protein kinase
VEDSTLQLGRIGRYRLLRELGEGAMARVYLAELDALGGFRRKVALKVIRPDYARDEKFVKLLAREAMIGSRLQHPNIVETLEFNEDKGRHYLALQFVEGETLADLLKGAEEDGDPGLPRVLAVESIIQVLKGLSYAHALEDSDGTPFGIIHRDLKPANIMLSRHGQVKVMDFGIAKAKVAAANITTVGQVRGTPIYMAPEQVTGKDMDGRTDQFAVATVLFELLTGEQVFVAGNLVMIMQRVARADVGDAPARADRLVPGVARVLTRMWQKRPEDRYPDCDAAASDLEVLLLSGAATDQVLTTPPAAPAEKKTKPRRKGRTTKKKAKEGGVLNFVSGLLGRKPPPPKKRRRKKRRTPEAAVPAPSLPPSAAPPAPARLGPPQTGPDMVFEDSTFGSSSFDLTPASGLVADGPSRAQREQDSVATSPSLSAIGPVTDPDDAPAGRVLASTDLPSSPSLSAIEPPSRDPVPAMGPSDGATELPTTAALEPRAELLRSDDSDRVDGPDLAQLPEVFADSDTDREPIAMIAKARKSVFDPPTSEHLSISDKDIEQRAGNEQTRPAPGPETEPASKDPSVSWGSQPPGLKKGATSDPSDEEDTTPMDDFFFGDFKE